jgi:hypothetical protein
MQTPTTFPIGGDLVARIDRSRPVRVVLERQGQALASLTWDEWARTHGQLHRAVKGEPAASKP